MRENQRKCDKISHVILPSIILADPPRSRSNPLDHEKDPPPPSRGTENLENKRDGGKKSQKNGQNVSRTKLLPKTLSSPLSFLCIQRFFLSLPSPPSPLLPPSSSIIFLSSKYHRVYILRMP